ncbi:tetratricopeptide repeat protein [Ferrovibrio sp.]|uniref:tetratricopeptide repeat protein n=1 Tax=Ferrovibrio sp. TaxID=1917215 RepID=UPI00351698CA
MTGADPRGKSLQAWLLDGIRAHEAGNLASARHCYEAALHLSPEQHDALHLLGVVADQEGRHAEAVDLIRRAIAVSPQAAAPHGNLATALLALGDEAGAETEYRQAVTLDPDYIDGYINLGKLLHRARQFADARPFYEEALRRAPRNSEAHRGIAMVLMAQRDMESAQRHLEIALKLEPAAADLHDKMSLVLRSRQQLKAAAQHSRKAADLEPDNLEYQERLALALTKLQSAKALAKATRIYDAVLARQPERVTALVGQAALMLQLQKPGEVLKYADRAIAIDPENAGALSSRSSALMLLGRIDEAMQDGERALAIAPDNSEIILHHGTLRQHYGDYLGALEDFRTALHTQPPPQENLLHKINLSLSLVLLSLGRLREGWPLYRSRTQVSDAHPRNRIFLDLLPDWDGIVRPGQRLLVWGEQGVGDQIIFSQMLAELGARGAEFCCAFDLRLLPLFRRSFPGFRFEPILEDGYERLKAQADVQIGVGELGAVLRPTLDEFPPARPFLQADPGLVEAFRERYRAHGRRHIVGLSWRSKNPYIGQYKSIPLLNWAPVLQQPDVLFVDLQYGDTAEDREKVRAELGVEILHDDSVDSIKDIDRYAAQVAAMDLVIGSSNTGVHVAGALGKEVWVLLAAGLSRQWYWFLDRGDSPWYAHARLFRQPLGRADDWDATVGEVAAALQSWCRDHTP